MKKTLIERMKKYKDTPKTWIMEVEKLERTIKEQEQKIEEYGQIIDVLAREMEELKGEPNARDESKS